MKFAAVMGACLLVAAVFFLALLKIAGGLDRTEKDAARAFNDVLLKLPPEEEGGGYKITFPDGAAEFIWAGAIVQMKADAAPFIQAGLDVSRLPNADESALYFSQEFAMLGEDQPTPQKGFLYIVRVGREAVGYHGETDRYHLNLGDGNRLEWAKEREKNDQDIVFVLEAEPLIGAGVDPDNVEGWTYTKVSAEVDGKPAEVWKFLKSFDLR